MKKIDIFHFLFLLIIFFFPQIIYSQNIQEILIKADLKISALKNYQYSYSGVAYMPPMSPDTLISHYNVYSIKNNEDSIVGRYYFIDGTRTDCGRNIKFYNGSEYFSSNEQIGKLNPSDDNFAMSVVNSCCEDFYFNAQYLFIRNLLIKDEALRLKLLKDTVINNEMSFHIQGVFIDKNLIHPLFKFVGGNINSLIESKGIRNEVDIFISKSDSMPNLSEYRRFLDNDMEMYTCEKIEKVKINMDEDFLIPQGFNFKYLNDTSNVENNQNDSIKKASNFCLFNTDSVPFCLNSIKSKNILIVFGSRGCSGCIKLLPSLNSFYNNSKNSNVSIVYINFFPNISKMRLYKRKNNLDFELYLGNKEVFEKYGIKGFPTAFFIDKDENIIRTFVGSMTESQLEEFTKY